MERLEQTNDSRNLNRQPAFGRVDGGNRRSTFDGSMVRELQNAQRNRRVGDGGGFKHAQRERIYYNKLKNIGYLGN